MNTIFALSIICFAWILPMYVSGCICAHRRRSVNKGQFVSFFTGWIGTAIIWLFLADKTYTRTLGSSSNPL